MVIITVDGQWWVTTTDGRASVVRSPPTLGGDAHVLQGARHRQQCRRRICRTTDSMICGRGQIELSTAGGYHMIKPGWGASFEGEPADVAGWAEVLKDPFDPWVETHDTKTVLRSLSFDDLISADEVRDRAVALIERLNGVLLLSERLGPVRFGGSVIEFRQNGAVNRTMFAEGASIGISRGRAVSAMVGPDGNPIIQPPQASDAQKWAALAEKYDVLDDALIFFGKGASWFDIYKALECLYARAGSKHAFWALNWEPDTERLHTTANWFRPRETKE